jgi:putative peptidoglycan lipid II flippase
MTAASIDHPPPATRLARDSLIVGVATVLSRILGFVRDILIARALGAGPIADAFLVAFRLPNMFRRVLGEGGLNAPFVPVYLGLKTDHGSGEARRFAGEAAGNFAAVLLIAVGLSELIAPWLVLALAGGFRDAPLTYQLAQSYTRMALPFVGFTVMASLLAAILNAEKRFAVAALAPISLNIVLISVLLWSEWQDLTAFRTAKSLAFFVSVAGALHLLLVFWALGWKAPGIPRFRLGWSPPMRRLIMLGVPALLASATSQFVLLVATQIASVQPGAVSWLYYADRVFQLPLGFVAVAMGVVLLPEIAAREAEHDDAGRKRTVDSALALGLLLAIPAATALAVLAEPIVAVLFERGKFGPADREQTAAALAAFAIGLPGAVIAKVLAQVYFARQNPGKPLIVGITSIAVAAIAGTLLAQGMPATGAALAASVAFWVQSLLLGSLLAYQRLWSPGMALMRTVLAALAAAVLMGAGIMWLGGEVHAMLVGRIAGLREFALLIGLCGAGVAVYAVAVWSFGVLRSDLLGGGRRKARAAEANG